MKIRIDKDVVSFTPEHAAETAELEALWIKLGNCVGNTKFLQPIGTYVPSENKSAAFHIEGLNEQEKKVQAQEVAHKLENLTLRFHVKSGKEGRVFGSVSTKQIVEELRKQGINVDKRKILDTSPVSSLGVTKVRVELYKDVIGTINVHLLEK